MKLKNGFICLVCIILLHSCRWMAECFPEYKGTVLSNLTRTPIQGVTVQLINENITVKTDKNGFFKLLANGCSDPQIRISKENYKPFEMTLRTSSNTNSYKVKSKSMSVDYDKPFYTDPKDSNSSSLTGTWIKQNSESFSVSSGNLTYYLDTLKSVKEEVRDIQNQIRESVNSKK